MKRKLEKEGIEILGISEFFLEELDPIGGPPQIFEVENLEVMRIKEIFVRVSCARVKQN